MDERAYGNRDVDAELSRVLSAFPLFAPRVLASFDSSTRNDLWLIEDAGSGSYVLTRHRQHGQQPGRVEFQLNFLEHLRSNNFPTAQVVKTNLGGSLFVDVNGMPWSLSTYVEGRHYDFQCVGQVREAARRLAEFHSIADSFPGKEFRLDHYRPFRDRWIHAYENQAAFRELLPPAKFDDEFAALRERDFSLLSEWPLERFDRLPVGWAHVDYHGRNMVFRGAELCALLDFDEVTREPLVWDIANAVYMFGREARGSFVIRPFVAKMFLDVYGEYHRLSGEEREAISMVLAMKFPDDVEYYRYCQSIGEDIEARFQREIAMMQSLQEAVVTLGDVLFE